MRFDEKPKRRSLHLKKSHAELPRENGSKRSKTKLSAPKKATKAKIDPLDEAFEEANTYKRTKPEKLPEDYDEVESFSESLKSGIKNHVWVVVAIVILLVAVGFFTGTIQKVFHKVEGEETAAKTDEEYVYKPKTVFTQGKFDLNIENTDAGVEIICETQTDEAGNEKKSCRAKTDEDRKKEEEEKEREEQEKKAAEEREKEDKEDQEARENKQRVAASSSSATTTTTEKEETTKTTGPVRTIGITSISGCPAEVVAGSVLTLRASVLPYNAANQGVIWISTNSVNVVFEGNGNTATATIGSGERAIITAMSVDGGFEAHCVVPIVSSLTY